MWEMCTVKPKSRWWVKCIFKAFTTDFWFYFLGEFLRKKMAKSLQQLCHQCRVKSLRYKQGNSEYVALLNMSNVLFSSLTTLGNSELCIWCRDMFTVYGNNNFVASLGAVFSIFVKPLKTKLNSLGCSCIHCKDVQVQIILQYTLYQQHILPCTALNKLYGRETYLTFFNWICQL